MSGTPSCLMRCCFRTAWQCAPPIVLSAQRNCRVPNDGDLGKKCERSRQDLAGSRKGQLSPSPLTVEIFEPEAQGDLPSRSGPSLLRI